VTDRGRTFPRGLVLGLTMAEIAILIIFVLLLALAALLAREADRRQAAERKVADYEQIEILFEDEALPRDPVALRAVLRERVDEHRDADNWRELVREMEAGDADPAVLAEQLTQARERIERLEAQAAARGGGGLDHPSCWYDRDGTVAYLFDVALAPDGFVAAMARAPEHEAERQLLPVESVRTSRLLTESQFLRQTRSVYEWSVERGCRFFVRAFDLVAADRKDLYKRRMRVLESRFYKNANPTGGLPAGLRSAR